MQLVSMDCSPEQRQRLLLWSLSHLIAQTTYIGILTHCLGLKGINSAMRESLNVYRGLG